MKTKIFKFVVGTIATMAIAAGVGYYSYLQAKDKYFRELKETIDEIYLEGQSEIGAFRYENDSIQVKKVSDFSLDENLSWLMTNSEIFWGGLRFTHREVISEMLTNGKYEWYDFNDCSTNYPFMIVVKQTDRGYDIIGECILGIGLTHLFPNNQITEKVTKHNWGLLSNKEESVTHSYKIQTDIVYSYIKSILEEKYNGITIRNEETKDRSGYDKNVKLEMLNRLVMKGACPIDSSLHFRINKYFELKLDDRFNTMGSSPVIWHTGSYGNDIQTIFTKTITTHYSIQENSEVLFSEYKKKIIIGLLVLEILYTLLFIIIGKVKNKK